MSESTPHKPPSRQVAPYVSNEPSIRSEDPRSQESLKTAMEGEIGDQTFEFTSSELARILSPKKPKPDVVVSESLLYLEDYLCRVDNPAFEVALDDAVARLRPFPSDPPGTGEAAYYPALADFLTECVVACNRALDGREDFPKHNERLYNDLEFVVGKPAADGIEGAAPLKPDITGGKGISKFKDMRLYWNPPAHKPPTQAIMIPVEVKNRWTPMVSQAATYARSFFSEGPMRMFALVLAFDHTKKQLRFLVFHRGGIAASRLSDITTADGLKEVVRLFLTLVSWSTPAEAGIVTCCDDTTYLIPADEKGEQAVSATVDDMLFRSLCVRGRMTRVFLLLLRKRALPMGSRVRKRKPSAESAVGLRRSSRFTSDKKFASPGPVVSDPVQGASKRRGGRSRNLMPKQPTTVPREKLKSVTEEQGPEVAGIGPRPATRSVTKKPASLPKVSKQTDDADKEVHFGPSVQLKYFQPQRVERSKEDPTLSDMGDVVVLKTSWPGVDRRRNEAEMFASCDGRFGVMPHVCSYEVTDEHRVVISNILFFPKQDQIAGHFWPVFSETHPRTLDIRTYKHTILGSAKGLLTQAENPLQLSRAWADSLLGWLSVYLSGHLHRDPSLGNILMNPVEPRKKGFEIPKEFRDYLSSLKNKENEEAVKNEGVVKNEEAVKNEVAKNKKAVEAIEEQCAKIQELVVKLDISNKHSAVITDGDLAVSWRKYWDADRRTAKSGTPEFMSRALLDAKGEYLHSPVDDLESFFWVALWSVVFHVKAQPKLEPEWELRKALLRNDKDRAMRLFVDELHGNEGCDDVMLRFQGVIHDWWKKLWGQRREWRLEVMARHPPNAGSEYYLPHFHRFALRGVLDVLEVLDKHWKGEISWKSWTAL